jgi:2-oxoacid:acceptor oxidoreductase gamma subunit (pyruvate/2-ketoisovalerate family)
MHEVIWHGRGGQGVVIAAQILAEAAYFQGYKGVTSAPTFGPERRGAPLMASTRISSDPIRMVSQIEHADISVVLDPSLISVVNILGTLKEGGLIIINSPLKPDDIELNAKIRIATVNA